MAQHYPVDLSKEKPQVKKSIERIGKYIAKSSWLRSLNNFQREMVYTKNIVFLSPDYHEQGDGFVVTIFPYKLNPSNWDGRVNGARLECHFNAKGEINKIYYPL